MGNAGSTVLTEQVWRTGPGGIKSVDKHATEIQRLTRLLDDATESQRKAEKERNTAWETKAQFRRVARASADRANRQKLRANKLTVEIEALVTRIGILERELGAFRELVGPRRASKETHFCGCGCLLAYAGEDCPNCRAALIGRRETRAA